MKYLFLIIVFVLTIISCKPTYVRKGIKQINLEKEQLIENYNYFQNIDSIQIQKLYEAYFDKIDTINTYFKDQYSDGAWKIMTDFGQIKGSLKPYIKNAHKIHGEYLYSLQQLVDLERDLKEKLITKEQVEIYLMSEKNANKQLIDKSKLMVDNVSRGVVNYHNLTPRIDSLIIVFKSGLR